MFSTVNYMFLDSSTSWQILFQDSATPVMEGIINLHHDLMLEFFYIFEKKMQGQ